MQVLDRGIFLKLKALAKSRGVTVQELIRVLVIPDWMRKSQEELRRTEDRRRHRRLAGPARRPRHALATGRPPPRKRERVCILPPPGGRSRRPRIKILPPPFPTALS